jgi:peroxiredoxin
MRSIITLITAILVMQASASPENAGRIQRSFVLTNEAWELKLKLAATEEEKQALWEKRPNPATAAHELWPEISNSLASDWVIPYATFFLDLTRNTAEPALLEHRKDLIAKFTEHHLKKPGIASFCAALIESGSPQTIATLEKIVQSNPDETTQGVASMGLALSLKQLGDTPEILKKRITYLRTAIIHAADQEIGNTSIADIASNELYIIQHLSEGRVAPEFSGKDVSGKTISLADLRGKVAVIFFWDANSPETDRIIEITNRLADKVRDQPVAILGITPESLERIRELQGSDAIRWNNIIDPAEKISSIYRISQRPVVFVLNREGEIQYSGLPGSFVDMTVDGLLSPDE